VGYGNFKILDETNVYMKLEAENDVNLQVENDIIF
jgi:hypothetical protein